jgi:cobaltochelatase CobS
MKNESQHYCLQEVIKILTARLNLFLVGEAGAGKTYLVEQAAKQMNIPFYCTSVCYQTSAASLLGYMDATGNYIVTLFRKAYEFGGIFFFVEIDNGNENVLGVFNCGI